MSRIGDYVSLVKFEHSVFALPFVLAAALVHAQGLPTTRQLLWMMVAAVSARTSAMAFNRIVDREFDALNPRTASRELPTGRISVFRAWVLTVVSACLFVLAAAMLNRVCFALSLPALAVLLGYSYTKRFTAWSHGVLGLSLGIAPMGAWLAVKPTFDLAPMVLSLAVICWVAGFDIIYALLDEQFDREQGLHSAVVALGPRRALALSGALHFLFLILMTVFGQLVDIAGLPYFAALAIVAIVLWIEHRIVSPENRSRINTAFFTANGIASIVILLGVGVEVFL